MYLLNGFLILCLLLFSSLDGFAKVYKWVDKNGQTHIADKKVLEGCLRGDCINGTGTYFLADGQRYTGEFENGKFHGQGIATFPDGSEYMGGFKNGIPHGQGILTDSDGRRYVGEFKDGKFDGQGALIDTDGTIRKTGKPLPKNPISVIDRTKAKNDLKESLLRKYGDSYSTIKLLLDSGMKAYEYLCEIPSNSINNGILAKLNREYYPNFSTIEMLYKSNIKAYSELNLEEQKKEGIDSQPHVTEITTSTEYKTMSKQLFSAGKFDEAEVFMSNSIELNKNDLEAYFIRAVIYQKLKKNKLAIKDIDRCVELEPTNGKYYHDRAILLITENKFQLAFDDIKTAERLGYIGELTGKIKNIENDFNMLQIRARSGNKKAQSLLTEKGVSW